MIIHEGVSIKNTAFQFLKRHSLVIGIILMFIYTWTIDLSNAGILPFQVPFPIYITLGWGFILISLIMTGITLGKGAVISLLKRYVQWRVGWKWFLVALLLEPALIVVSVYLYAVLTHIAPDFSTVIAYKLFGISASLPLLFLPYFLVEIFANGEEMGWRGYILPRLQAKYDALTSTFILGVIWGFWHLPKFLTHFDTIAFALFMLHIMAFAVILTWLYNNTRGSLFIVAISHAISNTVSIFVPMASTVSNENSGSYIIYVLLEVVVAIVIIYFSGSARLSRIEKKQIQIG